jgi:hypothetical protein
LDFKGSIAQNLECLLAQVILNIRESMEEITGTLKILHQGSNQTSFSLYHTDSHGSPNINCPMPMVKRICLTGQPSQSFPRWCYPNSQLLFLGPRCFQSGYSPFLLIENALQGKIWQNQIWFG